MRDHAQRIIDGLEPHDGAAIAQMLEDEIERRNLHFTYVGKLAALCETQNDGAQQYSPLAVFALIRATPEQKARAFLEVVKQ
jgi:hypothetical protein